ncbi:MAG: hypothetical protein M1609_09035 [Firmicutes bacterium]|nr:hypothetical protein [Bacillota bacterium]
MPVEKAPFERRVVQEETILTWKAPSRPYQKKQTQALTVPMIIAALVGLVLLVAGEWMIIAVVAALVFAYYAWTMVPPEQVDYAITTRGVRARDRVYEWKDLRRWWLEEKWGQELLVLEAPVEIMGRVVMPLGEVSEEKIEKVMEKLLLKERPAETVLDRAGKWLGEKFPLEDKI